MTGRLFFTTQEPGTDARVVYVNSDGTGQTILVNNVPTEDLISYYPREVGVDTAAGLYFVLSTNGISDHAYLLRGSLGSAAAPVIAVDFPDAIIANSIQLDAINRKIYVTYQDGSSTPNGAITGIRTYGYDQAGTLTDLGFLTTANSDNRANEGGFSVLDPQDFALDPTIGRMFYTETIVGLTQGIFRLDLANPNTATQLVSQAQFPDNGSAGLVQDIEVDTTTDLVYFTTSSQHPSPDATYNASQNALWYISENATNGTAAKVALTGLPGGNHLYPWDMTFDQASRQIYIQSEDTFVGNGANNDVIYVFQLDAAGTSAALIRTITSSPQFTNDYGQFGGLSFAQLAQLGVSGTTTAVVEQNATPTTLLASAPTITDDGGYLASATVRITGGTFTSNENSFTDDTLGYGAGMQQSGTVAGTSITLSWSQAAGTLTLTGYDTFAHYATALSGIGFVSSGDNPTNYGLNTSRTLTWTINDGTVANPEGTESSATTTVTITGGDDAPASTSLSSDNQIWFTGSGAVALDVGSNATITDVDSLNFAGGSLQIDINVGEAAGEDVLSIAATGGVTSTATTVSVGGVQIATWSGGSAGVPLTFLFDGDATPAAVQALVHALRYDNTSATPVEGQRWMAWTLDDGAGGVMNVTTGVEVIDTHPGVTVEQTAFGDAGDPAGPNKPSAFTITFSEAIDPASFSLADLSLGFTGAGTATLGTLTAITPGLTYSVGVSATSDGVISLNVASGAAYAAGHSGEANYASSAPSNVDNVITWDQTAPTVTVEQAAGQSDPFAGAKVYFTVTFGEAVTGFDVGDVLLSGTAGATTVAITQPDPFDDLVYQLEVTGMTGPGTVTASVKANAVVDAALNSNGASTSVDNTITLTALSAPPVAQPDEVSTTEDTILTGNVFDSNGNGPDEDVDGPALSIAAVNGNAGLVGTEIELASGARLTLNANGTFSYDPHGKFDYLLSFLTAFNSGAANDHATDSFTYTLTGGGSTTVTVTVDGVASAGDEYWGNAGDNVINLDGNTTDDYFDLSQGGNDVAFGEGGNDAFYLGAAFNYHDAFVEGDSIEGGDGDNDQIGLEGDYSGANALTITGWMATDVEVIALLPGFDYDITTDALLSGGATMKIFAGNLGPDDDFTFDGSAETDGKFMVYAGGGIDHVTTGAGDDGIYFGPGKFNPATDRVDGGAGSNDQLALDGHYTVKLDGTAIQNIEVIALLKGAAGDLATYALTLDNSLIGAGDTLTVWGTPVETAMTINGSGELDGALKVYGGSAGDTLTGGAGNDWFWGGLGADRLAGGGGADTFAYTATAQSQVGGFDTIVGFDDATDKIDLAFAVSGFAGGATGSLDTATMGTTLEAAFAALATHQAGVFTATGGDQSGLSFLVVDANGTAGFQAGGDFVIAFETPSTPIDQLGMFV